jgi:Rrf2 family protein
MRLTKQTGHAIRILTDCAQAGGNLVKVAELSMRLGITKQNVFKIVHILSRAGFIKAVRGPGGGVRLARAANAIRIGDVVRTIEVTDVEIDGEARAALKPQRNSGSINAVLDEALTAFVAVLDQHTLADLAATRRPERATAAASKKMLAATVRQN